MKNGWLILLVAVVLVSDRRDGKIAFLLFDFRDLEEPAVEAQRVVVTEAPQ